MADYRDLAAALGGGYGQDIGGITPDTLITLKNGKTASAGDLLGLLKGFGQAIGSNLESLGRGGLSQFLGSPVDIANTIRTPYPMEVFGDVNYTPDKQLPGGSRDILGMMPRVTAPRQETAGMEELGGFMAPATAKLAGKAIKATEGMPVGMSIRSVKSPQETALALAQQRAALPVEQGGLGLPANNTAADRAKVMGIDTDAYHSTNASDITKFDLGKSSRGEGTSVALTPENAQAYGNITYPLKVDQQKIFDPTNKDQLKELKSYVENLIQQQKPYDKDSLSFYPFTSKKVLENLANPETGAYYLENEIISKSLKDLGYSGSIGMESGQSQLKIFNPDQIRSRFAAFDPFRKDVATATAMGVALPDLLAAEKEDKQKKLSKALAK
jgi:hypothetical protein